MQQPGMQGYAPQNYAPPQGFAPQPGQQFGMQGYPPQPGMQQPQQPGYPPQYGMQPPQPVGMQVQPPLSPTEGTNDPWTAPPAYSEVSPSAYGANFANPAFGASIPAQYYTQEQLAAMQAQSHEQKIQEELSRDSLTTAFQHMNMGNAFTPTFGEYKTLRHGTGVRSLDPQLDNVGAMLGFFLQNNTRPLVGIKVHGYHYETRTTGSGKNRSTRRVQVTDFSYTMDCTAHVIPLGYLQSLPKPGTGEARNFDQVCQEYLDSTNAMKSIKMFKTVDWNFDQACRLVSARIRQQGWRRHLSVTPTMGEFVVDITCPSNLAKCYTHPCTDIICCLTCLCILWHPIMWCYKKDFDQGLRSHFKMNITVEQWWAQNQGEVRMRY
jgi:hypothetical protein